ncbi:MAG: peptidylprolyl isomerase [Bacillales bacterium]|jgi:foldase protein PrsA|nr:peptidylprolyl isomerase [Bacillales bacterium]
MKKTALLWGLIGALLLTNILSLNIILKKQKKEGNYTLEKKEDIVATIDQDKVLKDEWLEYMEGKYGKIALREIINKKVIKKLAEQYNISVTKEEVERELNIIRLSTGENFQSLLGEEELLKEELTTNLLYEKIITKDVNIAEDKLLEYYNNNIDLYNIPKMYEANHIVVETEDEANQIVENLKLGVDFSSLAREFSIDSKTVANGGKIGYVNKDTVNSSYAALIDSLNIGEYSNPIKIDNGYAVIMFSNSLEAIKYDFSEVKNDIRRQLALQQINIELPVESFWDELKVKSELDI